MSLLTDRHLRILLVEDNPADALILQEAFLEAEINCEWTIIPDGEAASHLFAAPHSDHDLILVDFYLPHVNGPTLLERLSLNQTYAGVPRVLLSGVGIPPLDIHCSLSTCCEKPMDFGAAIHLARALASLTYTANPRVRAAAA